MHMGKGPAETHDEEPKTLSLLSGVGAGASPATEAELLESSGGGGKKVGQGAVVLGVVAVVAAGSLYLMRAAQGSINTAGPAAAEAKIEEVLAKVSKRENLAPESALRTENVEKLFQDTDAVVAMFATNVTEKQVPLQYIKKNPFQIADAPATKHEGPAQDVGAFAKTQRLKALQAELGKYKLYSVMSGPRSVAVINGDFYQERQKLGGFVITKIEPLCVTLAAEGQTFQLIIDHDPNKGR